jgi:hypothetical protein
MQKWHEYELMNRLERVWTIGVSEVHKTELKLWYGFERINVRTWKDIYARWCDILSDVDPESEKKLLVGDADGKWVFAWGDGITVSDDSWWSEVRVLAKLAPEDENGDV